MAIKGALKYASWGHKFPFTSYPDTEIAFWPGCSLAGATPRIVQGTAFLLEEHLQQKVGIILDCCFDPLHQLGEYGYESTMLNAFHKAATVTIYGKNPR